jgi:chromatin remodeling complex protein RSC6
MNNDNELLLNEFSDFHDDFLSIINAISLLKINMTELQNNLRNLEKKTNKKFKSFLKQNIKIKKMGNKKPSGFAKPSKISNELCKFLNKPDGTEMARTEVTQHLIKYIKNHNLENNENKKIIKPDDKLSTLLDINSDIELTYFNIQGYMNKHFT